MWIERSAKMLLHTDSRGNLLINCYIKVLNNLSKVLILECKYPNFFIGFIEYNLQDIKLPSYSTPVNEFCQIYTYNHVSPPINSLCNPFAVTGNQWFTFCHFVFSFSWILCKQNHSFLCLTSLIYHIAFQIFPQCCMYQ